MLPLNVLESKLQVSKLMSAETSGSVPLNWLLATFKFTKRDKKSKLGKLPVNLLFCKLRTLSFGLCAKLGIEPFEPFEPFKLLLEKSRLDKSGKL